MSDPASILAEGWFSAERVSAFGDGHINDTFLVAASGKRFVLQRINQLVFENPGRVMGNLSRVLDFFGRHSDGEKCDLLPELCLTRAGSSAYESETGQLWRLWRYVEGSRVVAATNDPEIARAAGAAFGRFQHVMAQFPEPELLPTIEGFHQLPHYLVEFDEARTQADAEVNRQIVQFVEARVNLAEMFNENNCYIHGDCKLNNLLFSEHDTRVLSIVDLDTIMRGHWAWDFGDLTRSLLSGGGLNVTSEPLRLFEAVVRGFLETSPVTADPAELTIAPRYMAFMLGVRFLTDHLNGDRYFKVSHSGENLQRAQQQFQLVAQLEGLADDFLILASRYAG